jgi:metallo-beta-lactamase family protein
VRAIGGYSAHADQKGLYKWVEHIKKGNKLKKVFVVQGEDGPSETFAQLLRDHLGINAKVPEMGDRVVL